MSILKNFKYVIYTDILINILLAFILLFSLFSNSFNIIPVKLTKHIFGLNLLIDDFESFHYIYLGIVLIYITQSYFF